MQRSAARSIRAVRALLWSIPMVAGAGGASAQQWRVTVDFAYFGTASPKNAAPGSFEEIVRVNPSRLVVAVALPVHRGQRSSFGGGLTFAPVFLEYMNWDFAEESARPDRLFNLHLEIEAARRIGQAWQLGAELYPGVQSDFDNVHANHFQIDALVTVDRLLEGGGRLGAGLYWNTFFGDGRLLPALRIETGDRFRVVGLLPHDLDMSYRIAEGVRAGVGGAVDGGRYHLGGGGSPGTRLIEFSTGSVGPLVEVGFRDGFQLRLQAGLTFRRRFSLFRDDALSRDLDLENGAFGRILVRIRP